ncbi:MAG: hypothetical protein IT331_12175 [Anaerolineae bacterium]|nr:hypothetical protein [Anaerolineae bacterium]
MTCHAVAASRADVMPAPPLICELRHEYGFGKTDGQRNLCNFDVTIDHLRRLRNQIGKRARPAAHLAILGAI